MYVGGADPFLIIADNSIPPQYSWFHIIFSIAAMYVAMLLTDWYVLFVALP